MANLTLCDMELTRVQTGPPVHQQPGPVGGPLTKEGLLKDLDERGARRSKCFWPALGVLAYVSLMAGIGYVIAMYVILPCNEIVM